MPFCKMCFDLGRPEYDKHDVRDSLRNTTCPYILNTKCKNCGNLGHTLSYCRVSMYSNSVPRNSVVKHIDIVKQFQKPNNPYDLLLCHDADDDVSNEVDEDYLPCIENIKWGKGFIVGSWADQVEYDNKKTWAQVLVR